MSIDAAYTRSLNYAGLPAAFSLSTTISSDLGTPFSETLAVAKAGTLSTRTDDNTGVLTMAGGHGFTDGQRLDVYWSGGSRRGMTIGTVATNSVPIDGGAGDNLPIATTAITAQVPTEEPVVVTGDDVVAIGLRFPLGGIAVFADESDVELLAVTLTTTLTTYCWAAADGGTNPLAGDAVAKVFISQGSTASTSTVSGLVQFDN